MMFRRKRERRARKRVAVYGACPGSGAAFVSLALAWGMTLEGAGGGEVSLIELGPGKLYAALDLDARFGAGGFRAYEDELTEMKGVGDVDNRLYGIRLLARRRNGRELGEAELMRAAHSVPGESCVLCCSGLPEELGFQVLAAAERRVLVVDPLPSKLASCFSAIGRFRLDFPDGIIAVNRMNPGVYRGELRELLGTADWSEIPALPAELIYRAEYSASPVFELKKAAPMLRQPVLELLGRL